MFWIYTWLGFNAAIVVVTLARYAYLNSPICTEKTRRNVQSVQIPNRRNLDREL